MAVLMVQYDVVYQVLEEMKQALQQEKYIPPPIGY